MLKEFENVYPIGLIHLAFVSKKLFQQFSIELVLSLIPKVIPFIRLGVITIRLLISCNHSFELDNSRN